VTDGHELGGVGAGRVSVGDVEREASAGGANTGAGGADDVGTGGTDDVGMGGTDASTGGGWIYSYLGRARSGGDGHHRRTADCQ
jgi:hypothetical protein